MSWKRGDFGKEYKDLAVDLLLGERKVLRYDYIK